jgi:hypothetical protein
VGHLDGPDRLHAITVGASARQFVLVDPTSTRSSRLPSRTAERPPQLPVCPPDKSVLSSPAATRGIRGGGAFACWRSCTSAP